MNSIWLLFGALVVLAIAGLVVSTMAEYQESRSTANRLARLEAALHAHGIEIED